MSSIGPVAARPAPPTINIQSTLPTASDLCKNVLLQCYLLATVTHVQSDVCNYYFIQYRDAGRAKGIKIIGTAVNAACRFGHARRRFVNPGLRETGFSPSTSVFPLSVSFHHCTLLICV